MKTFLVLVLVVAVGWLGWHYWLNRSNNTNITAMISSSPEATVPGVGGEGTEPANYSDTGTDTTAQNSVNIGTTGAVNTNSTVTVRTPAPRPKATVRPTATASPSPVPVLAFRTVEAMNGSNESGVLLISTAPNGYSELNFNVNGSPAGVHQPTYIYRGASCQGSEEIAWGLNPTINGSTMTILPIRPVDLLANDNLYVVIQQSADNNTRVSCAKI